MELKKLTGPQAGSLKYDLLTALSVAGLHGSPTLLTSLTRLSAMVTARYNWRLDEVSIGQAELARLWSVNERTVKREMKRLTQDGWLVCLRPGVRGRVGAYRLNYLRLYALTRDSWPSVGRDYVDRMEEMSGTRTVVRVDFAPQKPKPELTVVPGTDGAEGDVFGWASVARRLQISHPEMFESWFAKLREGQGAPGELRLIAPNRFVAGYVEMHLLRHLQDAATIAAISTKEAVPTVTIRAEG